MFDPLAILLVLNIAIIFAVPLLGDRPDDVARGLRVRRRGSVPSIRRGRRGAP